MPRNVYPVGRKRENHRESEAILMTDQEKKQNKNVYREETSQIHAPVDLILRTKQAVAEEEERLHKENQITSIDFNGAGMDGAESAGKKTESGWKKYYGRVPGWVLPVTAAAVFVLVLRVSVVQFSHFPADRDGGMDYAASAEDMPESAGEEGSMEGMSGSAGEEGLAGGMAESADEAGSTGDMAESADEAGSAEAMAKSEDEAGSTGAMVKSSGEKGSASGRPRNADAESLREGELLEDLEREEEMASSADMAEARKQSKSEDMQQAPYARAYLEFLTEYTQDSKDGKGQGARFSLVFVDDNDIPELLLMEDDCHAKGVKVFTYYQDQVVELGAFGSFGLMQYVERAGLIFSHYMGHGESDNDFFEIKEGQAVLICNMHSTPHRKNGIDTSLYEIDGVAVNEKTYRARWKALYEDQDYVLIGYKDGTPVEEAAESEWLRQ